MAWNTAFGVFKIAGVYEIDDDVLVVIVVKESKVPAVNRSLKLIGKFFYFFIFTVVERVHIPYVF